MNQYEGGLDNEAFNIRYVDEVRFNAAGRRIVGEADIYDFKGITVFRGGANTPEGALNTIAHEYQHLNPVNRSMFLRGGAAALAAENKGIYYGNRVEYIHRYGP